MFRMEALLISPAVLVSLEVAGCGTYGGSSNRVASVFIAATNVSSLRVPATPPPGVYQAKPYSCIVVVPGPVDSLAVKVPSTNQFAMRFIEPPLHLEPKR